MDREVDLRRWTGGECAEDRDRVAAEVAVALTYNRQSHVVMMATPADLEDLGLGFSLSERIIGRPQELLAARVLPRDQGLELAMTVADEALRRVASQRRNLTGRTGCGLCGAESLEQAMRPPRPVARLMEFTHGAIQRATHGLLDPGPVQSATGAVHCAAWCDAQGQVQVVREDVGRHNALDKLIGALNRDGEPPMKGFVVVSSRASYEMVYKAAAAGAEMLVAVSAPTALAIDYAHRSGLTLVGFARPGRHNVYTFPERLNDQQEGASHD